VTSREQFPKGRFIMFARTERLLLRPGWPEDWEALLRAINDEGIVCNLASAPWPYTGEAAREFASRPQDPMFPAFFLTLPGDDGAKFIGSCGLGRFDGGVELGYWIAREHWGQGFATEAAQAVIGIAQMLGHERLSCSHFADNPASARVIEKLGFERVASNMRYSAGRGEVSQSIGYKMSLVPYIADMAA
jgi:RimJ/RimL family protein N-acetyltransferase